MQKIRRIAEKNLMQIPSKFILQYVTHLKYSGKKTHLFFFFISVIILQNEKIIATQVF